MRYSLYIKSHADAPDWEHTIFGINSKEEAVDTFYKILHGEYDKEWIGDHLYEEDVEERGDDSSKYEQEEKDPS